MFVRHVLCLSLLWWGVCCAVAEAQSAKGKAAPRGDLAAMEAAQGNWSRWRGPLGDGISRETGLLDQWPAEGPPVVWKTEGLGRGYASVAIVDGLLYSMGTFDGETCLVCRRVTDGSAVWRTPITSGGGDPNCTPTVSGSRVYGVAHNGTLACCNAATGELVWQKSFTRDFGGQMHSSWGYSESPLIDGERLICTPGGSKAMVAALNAQSGEVIWTTPMPEKTGDKGTDGAGYASPVLAQCGGVKQYVTLVGRGAIGVAADSGQLLWGYNRVANGTANVPTPIVRGDYVFTSSGYGDGGTALLKISRQGKGLKADEVYWRSNNELQNHHGGMIAVGEHVYLGHGHNNGFPVCVDLRTGRAVWGPQRGPGSDSAAIAYADGHLYFRYENGIMALIEASPRGYQLKGQFKIAIDNGKSWPHPVIAGGKLYLRDQDELICYNVKK